MATNAESCLTWWIGTVGLEKQQSLYTHQLYPAKQCFTIEVYGWIGAENSIREPEESTCLQYFPENPLLFGLWK